MLDDIKKKGDIVFFNTAISYHQRGKPCLQRTLSQVKQVSPHCDTKLSWMIAVLLLPKTEEYKCYILSIIRYKYKNTYCYFY